MMMIIKVSRSPLPSELFLVGRYCTGMDLHCTGYVAHRSFHWDIVPIYYTAI